MKILTRSLILLITCWCSVSFASNTTLIKNAQIIDGSGKLPFQGHVLVVGDKISVISPVTDSSLLTNEQEFNQVIDAKGRVLAPGFIDLHAHGDPLTHGDFKNFLAMGVTSICLGQDGFSGYIEDFGQWQQQVALNGTAVNIIPFVGHGTLRQLSGINQQPVPSEQQQQDMEQRLASLLKVTFGLSTGLEYNPALFSEQYELTQLAKVVGANHRIIMSHMRNEDDDKLIASIDELAQQGKFAPIHISHIKSVYGKGAARANEILDYLKQIQDSGINITADLYPYQASYTGIALLFPKWAKTKEQVAALSAEQNQQLLLHLRNRVLSRNGPEATLLGSGQFKGQTLAQVAKALNKPFEQVLLADIGPEGASAAYFIMDKALQQTLAASDAIAFSSDGSPTMFHPRGYGSFAKVIESYVMTEKLMSLATAIHKMTGFSAQILGLQTKGLIAAGKQADLVLFDPDEVKAMASYEQPNELAKGFDKVWVNGQLSKDGDNYLGRYGQLLTPDE